MPRLQLPPHLRNQFPAPACCRVEGGTVREALADLERQFPGLTRYVLDDQGALRKHVNVFVNGHWLSDRQGLADPVGPDDELMVFQALSGG